MPDYFSRNATTTPFKHPASVDFRNLISIDHIYAEERDGEVRVLEEHECRGDPVGRPATKLVDALQRSSVQFSSAWSFSLSAQNFPSCIVFGPVDFAINDFREDLSLLFTLGVMGKLCGRVDYLASHRTYAELLSGKGWGFAQGWWHRHRNVIVICTAREGSNLLLEAIGSALKIKRRKIIELDRDYLLAERMFEKATNILLDEAKKFPRQKDEFRFLG